MLHLPNSVALLLVPVVLKHPLLVLIKASNSLQCFRRQALKTSCWEISNTWLLGLHWVASTMQDRPFNNNISTNNSSNSFNNSTNRCLAVLLILTKDPLAALV